MRARLITFGFLFIAFASASGHVSAAEAEWLARHLPPAWDGGTPFTIKKIDVRRNHVDQEVVRAEYERTPAVVRTLAREIKLVVLPVGGGRHEFGADPGIAVSPRQSGTVGGIADGLLDYRGKVPGGARAYVELTFANAVRKQDPVRVSEVFWIGSPDELAAAKETDPPDPADATRQAVKRVGVPDDVALPAGMPVRFAGAGRWFNGTVVEQSAAGRPLKLIVYLARPGGLYLPWAVDAARGDVKVEAASLEAVRTDAGWFADRMREVDGRLAQGSAPLPLKPVGKKVVAGDRVVWFGVHGLMGGEVLADSQDGRVTVRDARFKKESVQEVRRLFADPQPPP